MINFLTLLSFAFMMGCSQSSNNISKSSDVVAHFEGLITNNSVSQFLNEVGTRRVDKLVINSPGGEPIAGMKLGQWIFDNKITVQVEKNCFSSCANYVFTAGTRKIVVSPGIVAWHGGAEQKDFREKDTIFLKIEQKKIAGEKLLESETALFNNQSEVANNEYSKQSRSIQAAFYRKLKISEYHTRVGQEPISYRSLWTVTSLNLKLFGICNVELPASYGEPMYLERATKEHGLKIILLSFNEQITNYLQKEIAMADYKINSCS